MSEHRLHEIVIERPRSGMRISSTKLTGTQKFLQQLTQEAAEDGLLRPYLLKPRYKTKGLSDHLGPLKRLLRSKVGQPWDDVYSELCQRLDRSTITGQHVIDHLWDFVIRDVEIIDGHPYAKPNTQRWRYTLIADGYSRNQFYVHPHTGLLMLAPKVCFRKLQPYPDRSQQCAEEIRIIDAYHQYRRIQQLWYWIEFKDLQPYTTSWDVLEKAAIDRAQSIRSYGRPIYAARKQQCNKRGLKKLQ